MAVKRVKKKEGEKLDEKNIERVISLLEQPKPVSKKEACEILNISYNTTRLAKIIEEFKDNKAQDEKRRAANRGKPATDYEIQTAVESYLEGETVAEIAKGLFRAADFVRKIIETVGVPQKRAGEDYMVFNALPEQCISEKFTVGELAWSSRYQAPCEICKEMGPSSDGESIVYQIYVLEAAEEPEEKFFASWGKPGFYAHQCAYDLGKLDHLAKYGVDIKRVLKRSGRS